MLTIVTLPTLPLLFIESSVKNSRGHGIIDGLTSLDCYLGFVLYCVLFLFFCFFFKKKIKTKAVKIKGAKKY